MLLTDRNFIKKKKAIKWNFDDEDDEAAKLKAQIIASGGQTDDRDTFESGNTSIEDLLQVRNSGKSKKNNNKLNSEQKMTSLIKRTVNNVDLKIPDQIHLGEITPNLRASVVKKTGNGLTTYTNQYHSIINSQKLPVPSPKERSA